MLGKKVTFLLTSNKFHILMLINIMIQRLFLGI
jgi:hypothetical protein